MYFLYVPKPINEHFVNYNINYSNYFKFIILLIAYYNKYFK
jgi:hypothetical protein